MFSCKKEWDYRYLPRYDSGSSASIYGYSEIVLVITSSEMDPCATIIAVVLQQLNKLTLLLL